MKTVLQCPLVTKRRLVTRVKRCLVTRVTVLRLLIVSFSIIVLTLNCSEDTRRNNNKKTPSSEISSSSKQAVQLPKMVDLGSKHCIPCKKMAPILDSLKIAYQGKAEIIFIDIKEDKKAARDYGITLIPTQVFIDARGNEIYRHIGFFPADSITAHLRAMGAQL